MLYNQELKAGDKVHASAGQLIKAVVGGLLPPSFSLSALLNVISSC